jgi:CubicO group peptidase (beta-lactamase class C family)
LLLFSKRSFFSKERTKELLLIGICALGAPCAAGQPAEWVRAVRPWGVVLTPPEGDTRIAIVHAQRAKTAQSAVAASWPLLEPGFAGKLLVSVQSPAPGGWDEKWDYQYTTPPNARRDIEAIPLRAGTAWTVVLIDGSDPTLEKRRADIRLILHGLKPAGYVSESFARRTAHPLDAARVASLVAFVRDGMRELDVPGVALALSDHGKIVYEGGLGVRERGQRAPVDAHTLFMIASNTKGMTTLLLSALVDQKKLSWEEKVTDAYPAFRLGDAATTSEVQIKHLVCACTGLPRQDLEWFLNDSAATPASDTFTKLAAMQPSTAFGTTYQYSNLMAAAAGYVGGHVVHPDQEIGGAYDAAMQAMIFGPLGMRDTTFDFPTALKGNHASPHGDNIHGKLAVASADLNRPIVSLRPAGGAWSSAHDMMLYVQDELTLGKLPNRQQLVSPANLLARREAGVSMGDDQTYGMGLRVDTGYGIPVVHHGGSLAGYNSDFFVIPAAGVGAVLLTNADNGGLLLRPFLRRLVEVLYDGKQEAAREVAASAAAARALLAAERGSLSIPPDSAMAAKLAPRYENKALGHIDVHRAGSAVTFDFGAWHSRVASRRNTDDSVSFVTTDPAVIGKTFVLTGTGAASGLIIRDGQHEYRYASVKR